MIDKLMDKVAAGKIVLHLWHQLLTRCWATPPA